MQLVALEGVLGGVGGGQHGTAAALALEPLQRVYVGVVAFGELAGREGAAVAAVEDQHLLPGVAGAHGPIDPLRGQGGEHEVGAAGVGRGEVEPALVVLETVPGEVQQGQVVVAAVAEEIAESRADPVMRFVDQNLHLEPGDVRRAQHLGQRLGVVTGRGQLPQSLVVIRVRGDQQGQPTSHGYSPPAP